MPAAVPWRKTDDGLELHLRVTPNAGTTRIDGIEIRDDGRPVLRVRVAAVPDRGKANKAVVVLIAARFDLPKSAVTLESGETARFKLFHLKGVPDALAKKAASLFQSDA